MNKYLSQLLILLLLFSLIKPVFYNQPVHAETVIDQVLEPSADISEDAYGNYPNGNEQLYNQHRVGFDQFDGFGYGEAALKFDLSSVAQVRKATLKIYASGVDGSSRSLYLYSSEDDSWSESNPVVPSKLDLLQTLPIEGNGYFEIDVSSFVKQEWNSDKLVSFVLAGSENTQFAFKDQSVASENTKTKLEITYAKAPTDITLSNSSVKENQSIGTVVGTLSTSDPNDGDRFTYSLKENDYSNRFKIVGNQLVTATSLDYETDFNAFDVVIKSTDEDGLSIEKTFEISLEDIEDNNANLQDLKIDGFSFDQTFSKDTTSYTVTVSNDTESVHVRPLVEDEFASFRVRVNDKYPMPNDGYVVIDLVMGSNVVEVEVTAGDGSTTKVYQIEIVRPSNNANLSDLTINKGYLSPTFESATTEYTTIVPYETDSIEVTPTTENEDAIVKVAGQPIDSGTAHSVPLEVGSNTITIEVTAADGTVKEYTLTVVRDDLVRVSRLSDLMISDVELEPVFDPIIGGYIAFTGKDVAAVTVTTVREVESDQVTLYTKSGDEWETLDDGVESSPIPLEIGENSLTIRLKDAEGSGESYNQYDIKIYRGLSNANLSHLGVSRGSLSPSFDPDTTEYTIEAPFSMNEIYLTPTLEADQVLPFPPGIIIVNNDFSSPVNSGEQSVVLPLEVGENKITLDVYAADNFISPDGSIVGPSELNNTVKRYTINVYRAELTEKPPVTDYEYTDNGDGTATITEYLGEATDVVIPDTVNGLIVTRIGDSAFANKQLTSVTIPDSVKSILVGAFGGNQLERVTLSESLISIGDSAFFGNPLESVVIPKNVKSIGENAFKFNQLKNVSIPNGVTSIGKYAFYGNQLENVTIPNSVTSIGEAAFESNSLKSVIISESMTNIQTSVFSNNQLESVIIPENISNIEDYAFSSNQLKSVIVLGSDISIEGFAFLSNQMTPSDLTIFGHDLSTLNDNLGMWGYTFLNISHHLRNLVISEGDLFPLFEPGTLSYTLRVEDSVESITVTPSIADVNTTISINGVEVTSGQETVPINLSDTNNISIKLTALDGTTKTYEIKVVKHDYLYANNGDGTATITDYIGSGTDIEIPSEIDELKVEKIGESAFYKNQLTSVTIPESVTSIESHAFASNQLERVIILGNDTNIESGAFSDNQVNPSDLTIIGYGPSIAKNYAENEGYTFQNISFLRSLEVSEGALSPEFSPSTMSYSINLGNSINSITVTPTAADNHAIVAVNGVEIISGQASEPINLNVGNHTIIVDITDRDGATITYEILVHVEKGDSPPSDDDSNDDSNGDPDDDSNDDSNGDSDDDSNDDSNDESNNDSIDDSCQSENCLDLEAGNASELAIDGMSIAIPENAINKNTTLTIEDVTSRVDESITHDHIFLSPIYEALKTNSDVFLKPVTLTFHFDPEKVEKGQTVSVFYYDEDSEEWVEIGGTVNENRISVQVNHFTKFAVMASENLREAYINGYPDGTFRPSESINRLQMAIMLGQLLGYREEELIEESFQDIELTHPYAGVLAYVKNLGLMVGDEAGYFRPDDIVTRAQLATIISNYKQFDIKEGVPLSFSDTKGHWAKWFIEATHEAGIIIGFGDGTFRPDDPLTRAQAVVMLNHMVDRGPLLGITEPSFLDVSSSHWAFNHIESASRDYNYLIDEEGNERINE